MPDFFTIENLISLITLTVMEIVLGVDNILFISIIAGKLPHNRQHKARIIGLSLAMLVRICLLLSITALVHLKSSFVLWGYTITAHDLIMLGGGIFLMYKSITEIGEKLSGDTHHDTGGPPMTFVSAIFQIVLLDIIFSFDSILTAIGVAKNVGVMIVAVVISMGLMMVGSGKVSDIVNKFPSVKMLALAFLLMIGFLLVIDGLPDQLHVEIKKEYLYFAMAFAVTVEILNIRARQKRKEKRLQRKAEKEHKNE